MSAFADVVHHQELAEQNGLALNAGRVFAYRDGQIVGEAEVPAEAELRSMLLGYEIPELLPELSFCLTEPQEFTVELSLQPSLPDEVGGLVCLNGEDQLWYAHRQTHPDFRRHEELPKGVRSWATTGDSGWEIMLAGVIQTHPDRVVPRRVALAVEAFLCALATDKPMQKDYRSKFSNVFSAREPMWNLNLPRLLSVEQRGQSDWN